MRRNLILLCYLFFVIPALGQQVQTDEHLVDSFVKEWIESSGSEDCALKYLDIHTSYVQDEEKKKLFFETFSLFGKTFKEEINKNDGKYQLIAHKTNNENDLIKKFNLKTVDYSGVYYLIVNGKIITSIIIKEGRIVSYCVIFVHPDKGRFEKPWYINEAFHNGLE
jgi:hypothetical protein